uniref:Uncharacterized protein n=1 Tax=viral metagenome TaxID=1070528 RepID=A0A6C0HKX9_9ZZZZ
MMIGAQLHNGVPYHPSTPKKVWRKIRKTIIVDSRDRQMNAGSHPGSYTVTLPTIYQNVVAATLKTVELPLSFYQFSAAMNNVTLNFTYSTTYGTAGAPLVATLPDGNYSAVSLVAALNAALNTALTAAGGPTGALTCAYSSTTGKITFTGLTTFTLYLTPSTPISARGGNSLTVNYTTWWGLGYFLGFTAGTQTATANPAPATNYSLVGQFSANPFPTNYILLDMDTMNKIDETSIDDLKAWKVNGAFAKIPTQGNSGDFVFLTDTAAYQLNRAVYSPPISKLSQLFIKFRLHDGRVIDFNGVEHSFTIELEMLDNNFDEFSSVEFSV